VGISVVSSGTTRGGFTNISLVGIIFLILVDDFEEEDDDDDDDVVSE
jgi:hypothetical protein